MIPLLCTRAPVLLSSSVGTELPYLNKENAGLMIRNPSGIPSGSAFLKVSKVEAITVDVDILPHGLRYASSRC